MGRGQGESFPTSGDPSLVLEVCSHCLGSGGGQESRAGLPVKLGFLSPPLLCPLGSQAVGRMRRALERKRCPRQSSKRWGKRASGGTGPQTVGERTGRRGPGHQGCHQESLPGKREPGT